MPAAWREVASAGRGVLAETPDLDVRRTIRFCSYMDSSARRSNERASPARNGKTAADARADRQEWRLRRRSAPRSPSRSARSPLNDSGRRMLVRCDIQVCEQHEELISPVERQDRWRGASVLVGVAARRQVLWFSWLDDQVGERAAARLAAGQAGRAQDDPGTSRGWAAGEHVVVGGAASGEPSLLSR